MDMQTDGMILVLQGDFDARSTWEVRDALYDLLDGHERDVVVDLTNVICADVTALRVLAAATRYAYREGHRVRLRGANPAVRRLLHLSRLIRLVELDRAPSPTWAEARLHAQRARAGSWVSSSVGRTRPPPRSPPRGARRS